MDFIHNSIRTSPTESIHAFISALHWFSLLQLLLHQNIFEHVVFSNLIPSSISRSLDMECECWGDSSWGSFSPESKFGQGPSLHVHNGIATEGNGPQVTGQKISEETEATRFFLISGEPPAASDVSCSRSLGWSMQGVHKLSDIGNLMSFAEEPGNLTKYWMPCRQRGQGMEPGGIDDSEGMLLVEQR